MTTYSYDPLGRMTVQMDANDARGVRTLLEGSTDAVVRLVNVTRTQVGTSSTPMAGDIGSRRAPDHPPITQDVADAYLAQDLQVALQAALRHCPVLATEPPQRLAAVVDFCFNLGAGRLQTSTLCRRINQRDWAEAAREMRRWVHGGGRVLPGLQARREIAAQWLWRDAARPDR